MLNSKSVIATLATFVLLGFAQVSMAADDMITCKMADGTEAQTTAADCTAKGGTAQEMNK